MACLSYKPARTADRSGHLPIDGMLETDADVVAAAVDVAVAAAVAGAGAASAAAAVTWLSS